MTGSEQGTVTGWCQSCRLLLVVEVISMEKFLSKTSVQTCWWVQNSVSLEHSEFLFCALVSENNTAGLQR